MLPHNINQIGKWVVEQYRLMQQYQRQNDAILRVVNIEQANPRQEPILHIQLVGKNFFVKKALSEIYANQVILEAFSKKDLQNITKLKTQWDLSPKKAISGHFEKEGQTFVTLTDSEGNTQIESIRQMSKNKSMMSNLSTKDAYLMGYLYGTEQF
ncbi:MAG: hypothetical protein U1E78_11580 [Gammaproteobacteria bacterium]